MSFLDILKPLRLERSLIPLSSIMIIVGFANKINLEIFILMICCILMYASGGIINAKIDKDYKINYFTPIILTILITSIIISFSNKIIFITVLLSFLLGFIYNKFSRKILFGDSIILALTHSTLPIISASLLLNLDKILIVYIANFMFLAIILVTPMKNLNGIDEDKKRGYKTLMTKYKNGKKITNFLLDIYFILLFLAYFIFQLGNKFLFIFIFIFLIKGLMNYFILENKEVHAYRLVKLVIILFSFAIVFDKTTQPIILLLSSSLIGGYFLYLIK